jgi:hypothetical protein
MNKKNNGYFIRITAAAAIISLYIPFLFFSSVFSRGEPNDFDFDFDFENYEAAQAVMAAGFINSANDGIREQRVSDLYANAGVAENAAFMRDFFDLSFSHTNYFYTECIYVEITSGIEGAEIFYTLDGSVPSRDNVSSNRRSGARAYTEPIYFYGTNYNEPHVLRAVAYLGDLKSRVLTHTYFVSGMIADRFDENTFVFSITTDPYNLYDFDHGIFVEGRLRSEWRAANPRAHVNPPSPANFNMRGREAERPIYVEVLKSDGRLLISQNAGIRTHGGWSRAADRKSMRIYARPEYDPFFDRLYYPFFGEHRRNDEHGSLITDYAMLLLRNGGNDRGGAMMREEFAQALAKKAGFLDYKEFAPAAVFVNGNYYGFFWLQNIYHECYFMNMYGGENPNLYDRPFWHQEPRPGNLTNDEVFRDFAENVADIDNYMLYYAFQIYASNWDWPHNNRRLWRYTGENGTQINKYYDGRFRMLIYDVESWGLYNNGWRARDIERIIQAGSAPAFSALMRRPDMVEKFCNQMFDLISSVFTYESMQEELERIVALCEHELNMAVSARALRNSRINIESNRRSMLRFAESRAAVVISDMAQTLRIRNQTYSVNVRGAENAGVILNTLRLNGAGDISSMYFTAHSVILKAEPHAGHVFDYWEINGEKYYSAEIILNADMAGGSIINAELFLK